MKFRFKLSSIFLTLLFISLLISHVLTSIELKRLKAETTGFIYEIVENGPNNGGGGSDIAILVVAQTPELALEESKKHGFTAPWTTYEIGKCLGTRDSLLPHCLRGPYIVGAAVNSRQWKSFYADYGDPPTFRKDIYGEDGISK